MSSFSSSSPRSLVLRSWISALLLILLGIGGVMLLLEPMLRQGYPSTHSTHFNLSWGFQYQRQFFSGQIYPRWLEFSNFGFGNATFAFYPPLCMIATLPFRALGLDLNHSLVASMGLAIGVLGLGMYGYGRCFFPRWIALGMAGIAMASPYFLIDIYQRGAIGEVWAITFLPWILGYSQQVLRQPRSLWPILCLGISYGLLVLSHLPTLLLFTLVWIVLPWIANRGDLYTRLWGAIRCYGGAALAFGWTAFYLWPAAVDQRLVQVDSVNALPEYLPQNRLMVWGIRGWDLQFTQHWFETDLLAPWFLIGGITLGALALILGSYLRLNRPGSPLLIGPWGQLGGISWVQTLGNRMPRLNLTYPPDLPQSDPWVQQAAIYWAGTTLFTLLMMTDVLSGLYPLTGVLERIQFSWRWLGVTTVLIPPLLGYGLQVAAHQLRHPDQRRRLVGIWLALACFGATAGVMTQGTQVLERAVFLPDQVERFVQLAAEKTFPDEPQQRPGDPFIYWHWIFPDGLALVDVPEYRAHGVVMAMPPDRIYPLAAWADQIPTAELQIPTAESLEIQTWSFGHRQFQITNSTQQPRALVLRTFDYPAWQVQIDNRPIPTTATSLGQIQIPVPPGLHQVTVRYQGTPMDRIGRGASLLTIGLAIGLAYGWRRKTQKVLSQSIPI